MANTLTDDSSSTSGYLHLVLGGSHWHARNSLKNIIVFGDSYSKYYGSVSWVLDHLGKLLQTPPKIHNFAVPGATADHVLKNQIRGFFREFSETNDGESDPPLNPDETTYFVYLGINDCGGRGDNVLNAITTKLFVTLRDLYVKAKARNFVLIDVPPFERTPQIIKLRWVDRVNRNVTVWNEHLRNKAAEFQSDMDDTTLLLFSSHAFFTDLLDVPSKHGFSEEDTEMPEGAVWFDELHPTSRIHELLAKQIYTSIFEYQGEVDHGMERVCQHPARNISS
ncbi:hypothetical protein AGABI2DRAFT_75132 [Agaricus bisporus var. bisporus H97]|uniref:hypothetical protein n=1 Tax=Agaricus bisporus var. bisporus (strain H97 / ATCC MYA-4626 / FGSC 10389) TaxID=936046 RepID=UPI00029F7D30|nr:hypothetical protein AGABI2DRAFT_75132 [Agaricus bisporus var. bisporus H97]EKV44485.1 hypothetical protein AGABI2DRAFT_75132 [Agaricus bisporus var. bisporus H97]